MCNCLCDIPLKHTFKSGVMRQTNELNQGKPEHKLLGSHLIEAGLLTSNQIYEVLIEQKNNGNMRLGEILVKRGWIKQKTLDYFIEKIIEPNRVSVKTKNLSRKQNQREYIANLDYPYQRENEESSLPAYSAQLSRKLSLPTLNLSPKKICRFLLVVIAFLILSSCLAQIGVYFLSQSTSTDYSGRILNLDEEANIPSLYSALTLVLCSILLALISYLEKVVGSRYAGYWKALSLLFLFLSLDEAVSIHETLVLLLRLALNTSGFLNFTWVVLGSIFLAVFLLGFWRFIKALPQKTRNLFIQAGILYVGGTLGVDLIGEYYTNVYGENTIAYLTITTIEESLEMLGIVIFIYALLSYIKSHIEEVKFYLRFDSNRDK
jgi:hypothetical protein